MNRRQILKIGMLTGVSAFLSSCHNKIPTFEKKLNPLIKFKPTGKIIDKTQPTVRNMKMKWGRSAVKLYYSYEEGFINTVRGTEVKAFRLKKDSLKMAMVNIDSGGVINKPDAYFNQFRFDPSYNCFGYCFADSKVWLEDPSLFLKEEYEEVGYEDAQLIIFKKFENYGDNGEEVISNFHAAKILNNGNVSYKAGINKLVENVETKLAIDTFNFNHEVFFRKID